MTPRQLQRRIARLPKGTPIALRFEEAVARRKDRRKDPWFGKQQAHWLGWLSEYDGPGYYGRKQWDVGAESVYYRVVNPSMILWLAEAAGTSASTLRRAAAAALAGGTTMMQQSGAIRRVISWEMIEERLRSPAKRVARRN